MLLAVGVVISYVTLRPRAAAATVPAGEISTSGASRAVREIRAAVEIRAVGESLGELVSPTE